MAATTDTLRTDSGRFVIIPLWVLEASITDRSVRLYGFLSAHADKDGTGSFPSRRTLARLLHCSVDTVDRAKDELREVGALAWRHRTTDEGRQTSNDYTIRRALPPRQPEVGAAPTRPPRPHRRG